MIADGGVALDDEGNLHTWGATISPARKLPEIDVPIASITNGREHIVATDVNGKIYTWGNNHYTQLDAPDSVENVSSVYSDFFQNYVVEKKVGRLLGVTTALSLVLMIMVETCSNVYYKVVR